MDDLVATILQDQKQKGIATKWPSTQLEAREYLKQKAQIQLIVATDPEPLFELMVSTFWIICIIRI